MPKVSVIVPVFDPGANIDDCIGSLLGQSLTPEEYEVIFVDDGSTDATPARLDALAAEHPNVRVEHIPNSGWPGRPRNVGLDMAEGEFVFFADNDDWLEPEALERLHAMAIADSADIVVGKVVGHGKYVSPLLFRENLHAVSLADAPLVWLLSPHKLFRRAFLAEHGLRFPEGRRRLEDHVLVMRAYFATDRISVLADYPCYHWMNRGDNASSGSPWDPAMYYEAVREVLDIIDENTEPGEFRDRLYLRWYRPKTLGRVGGSRSALTTRSREWQRTVFAEVQSIVGERFGEHLDAQLPINERRRAALVRAGDFDEVLALAEFEARLAASGSVDEVRAEDGRLLLSATVRLRAGRRPLHLDPAEAPAALEAGWVRLLVRAAGSKDQHLIPSRAEPRLEGGDVVFAVEAELDPRTAAAGAALPAGDYDLPVTVSAGGFVGDGVLTKGGILPVAVRVATDGTARVPLFSSRTTMLALARRMPGLARRVKRMLGRR